MSDKVMQSAVHMKPPMYASCLHTAHFIPEDRPARQLANEMYYA